MKTPTKADLMLILKSPKGVNTKKKLKMFDKLGELKKREQIKIFLKILEDGSWILRERAAYRLAEFGGRIVPRLKKVCYQGLWFSRAAACITLGEIGDLRALNAIIQLLLNDENPTVIKEASVALCKIAQKQPVDFIRKIEKIVDDDIHRTMLLDIIKKWDIETYKMIKKDG